MPTTTEDYHMALTEGCVVSFQGKDAKESEDAIVTRIQSFKWVKIQKGDGSAEWIRSSLLKQKE